MPLNPAKPKLSFGRAHPAITGMGVELEGSWSCTVGAGQPEVSWDMTQYQRPVPCPDRQRNRANLFCLRNCTSPVCAHNRLVWATRSNYGWRRYDAMALEEFPMDGASLVALGQEPRRSNAIFHGTQRCVCPRVYHRDGSVTTVGQHTGEVQSPVCSTLLSLQEWIRANHPTTVNTSCGLHVHLSFRTLAHYGALVTPTLTTNLVNGVKEWSRELPQEYRDQLPDGLDERLSGGNQYCKHQFDADAQMRAETKYIDERYRVCNYGWRRMRTLEVRLLPMMPTADLSCAAVGRVLTIVSKQLSREMAKEPEGPSILAISPRSDNGVALLVPRPTEEEY